MLEEKITQDLKKALLGGDTHTVSTLRSIKSAILYAKIASNKREEALSDSSLTALLQKEARKRQESADLYEQGGNVEKANLELSEKRIIEHYLPTQLSETEVQQCVDDVIKELGASEQSSMGKVIALAKERLAGQADSALIARLAKEKLTT